MKTGLYYSFAAIMAGLFLGGEVFAASRATITETEVELKTYPYFDPDPIPATEATRYPYFFFDGTSAEGAPRKWKAVELENDKIKVTVVPEIGGKIWGAIDKRSGKDFVYYNHSVKFRNISMRGPWCSGGIEFNFGIIGHGPWTASPVSYFVRTNDDGSVSCFVSETELIARTTWQVEIRLGADAEGFETRTIWYNGSGFRMPYYQWMNAAFKASGNPSFEYPGKACIGHKGEILPWPVDEEGHQLTSYEGNAFGGAKSEHVMNGDNGFYGIWWPKDGLGVAHISHITQKYGRKVWIWPHSRAGGIWEDLLTDSDGQYVELQSGRAFNQPSDASYLTPFKHLSFAAGATDTFEEEWNVVRNREVFDRAWDESKYVRRPLKHPEGFDWEGVYGLYVRGGQRLRQKLERKGIADLEKCIAKDPYYAPALSLLASTYVRHGEYAKGRGYAERAMSIDTYDAEANYADGIVALAEGKLRLAKERLGIAAYSLEWRAAAYVAIARIELREGNFETAEKMAEKALDADRRNQDARIVRIISARKRGETGLARQRAEEMLKELPLSVMARYELNRVDPTTRPFVEYVRNELPHETYLEAGTWYEEAGLLDEAMELFEMAGKGTMIGLVRRAFVLHRLGREAEAKALLGDASLASIEFALPFRRETIPALEWAESAHDSWKFTYLKAVVYAANCRDSEGDAALEKCENVPEVSIFYLYRATRRSGEAKLGDLRRAEALGGGWRCGYALYEYYRDGEEWAKALATVESYIKKYDANKLKIAYATALVQNGRAREAIEYLGKVVIMPSEWGDNASSAWIDAWQAIAEEALARGDKKAAREAVNKAVSYPENLGAGKPFELDFKPFEDGKNPLLDWTEELRALIDKRAD